MELSESQVERLKKASAVMFGQAKAVNDDIENGEDLGGVFSNLEILRRQVSALTDTARAIAREQVGR